ncbi:SGNH/GDSL hydrolase family protein [Paraferrimonas sedimenticola]|uniref:SGNH hydrolase-type esterase domain-containing protein n=1 Tax=Paraferrimonas sedimenticola TaxID=375674 RepID=A0AA37RTR7_9GAMM|nr:SGNH/GDSL hydrolase family protein [Paraferrimonas sedimenticola]GLP95121.1 hypothetical protein GCM10007895_04270 [Paraferrimonas sedimenticola]
MQVKELLWYTCGIMLLPVLLLQGVWVRWRTPKLEEAEGERCGVSGEGEPLEVLILGDSAAAGVGVTHQSQALVGQMTAALAPHRKVSWQVMATSGDDCRDALTKVQQCDASAKDWVLLSLGVNHVTRLAPLASFDTELRALLEQIQLKFNPSQLVFFELPPMHAFPALPQPLRWWLGWRAKQVSQRAELIMAPHPSALFSSVPYRLEPSHIAADGFHPGEGAYSVWGSFSAQLILNREGDLQSNHRQD